MVEMERSYRILESPRALYLVLKEKHGPRCLMMTVNPQFATLLVNKFSRGLNYPRPQTHDLILKVIEEMGAKVSRAEIVRIENDRFCSNLYIEKEGKELVFDSLPSDAFLICFAKHVPFFCKDEILQNEGVIFTEEGRIVPAKNFFPFETPGGKVTPEEKEKLSPWKDFIEDLNLDL